MLFDVPKDAVFSIIFCFLVVNCSSKWTKTVNLGCAKILKNFSNTMYLIGLFQKKKQKGGEEG